MDKHEYVERTCTEVIDQEERRSTDSRPLAAFRDCSAYVLLGAPGAGKTTSFKQEAAEGNYCDVRDFITFGAKRWNGVKTLFIDGLDEMRAAATDGHTPLDAIRSKLDALGRPRFRLSCREADWFGSPDRRRLEAVSPDGGIKVLRLDPLSEDNIRDILNHHGVVEIDRFIDEANDRGLGALLSNPQTLKLLADAVAEGDWPATRTDTFQAACSRLVREQNEGHLRAVQQRPDAEMLRMAGYLCTVQLLSGQTGYRLPTRTDNVDGYIDLRVIPEERQGTLLAALYTKVFHVAGGLVTPIHRHIAEFLAGRYLAALIEDSLPVRRILALLLGEDGRTVSGLRGLASWLAAHSGTARRDIIDSDPLGTILYGDVERFSVDEKRRLLDLLQQDAESDPRVLGAMHDLDSRWEGLATPDMEDAFREVLTSTEGTEGRQAVTFAVLHALERGGMIPGLGPMLPDLVRDSRCWPLVREAALEAYMQQSDDGELAMDHELRTLLDDVYAGTVVDPDDQLLGLLLKRLYPDTLPPAHVGRFLRERKRRSLIGSYVYFWEEVLVAQSTDDQFADALDSIVEHRGHGALAVADDESSPYWLHELPGYLLATYLRRSPTVSSERLFDWLGLAAVDPSRDAEADISAWLTENPDSYKAVVRIAADRFPDPAELARETESRLFLAFEPTDYGAWCLAQAAQVKNNTAAASEFFLRRVVARQEQESLPDSTVERRLVHQPSVLATYEQLRERRANNAGRLASKIGAMEQRRRDREVERRKSRNDWRKHVETREHELRENRAAPRLLHGLASAYLGKYSDLRGATGRDRLQHLLGSDDLIDTVVQAFRDTPMRTDLPDDIEIFQLADERQHHLLMLPFLVGLDESQPVELCVGEPPLDERGMRRALAFRFQTPDLWNEKPCWYRTVVVERSDLVAEAFVQSIRSTLRRGASDGLGLYELGHDHDHRPVARLALGSLLKSYPVRGKVEQLSILQRLIFAALRHHDEDVFLQIVERKLTLRSMDVAQRVYWLCGGLLADPPTFAGRVNQMLAGPGAEQRIRHMAQFFVEIDRSFVTRLDSSALELLIASLGSSYRPPWAGDDSLSATNARPRTGTYTPFFINALIADLAADPSDAATNALQALGENAKLKPWYPRLHDATSRQLEIRREANFRHPTVEQVLETLDNRRPANTADLAALTMDVLTDLARDIRHGNTSDWRQYWNVSSPKQADEPRPENECRNHLLSDLKRMLAPLRVDAQQEVTYTDDKRADIRVSCDGFNVPIEIKRSAHDDLWTAIRNQLIAKYTHDPGADGYGIYLVFWFGRGYCKKPPTGPTPDTPDALREQLIAAANLSAEERRRISVIVIDVSKPKA